MRTSSSLTRSTSTSWPSLTGKHPARAGQALAGCDHLSAEVGTETARSRSDQHAVTANSQTLIPLLVILALPLHCARAHSQFHARPPARRRMVSVGSYAVFDSAGAQDVLDRSILPSGLLSLANHRIVYPPGYPLWLALIYKLTGNRSPVAVQYVQMALDSLAVLLVVGIGVSAFGWLAVDCRRAGGAVALARLFRRDAERGLAH